MIAENRVEDMGEEGNRSLWKMLQCPVRDTVLARSLAEVETPDSFVNIVTGGLTVVRWQGLKVRLQRHINHLNNCRHRTIGHRLKLSLQIVCKGFGILGV